jgi:SAM-dependent methyltransferase
MRFRWHAALCALLSALLMFQAEPLVAKLALPSFGGSPAVWTTSLVFYQVLLVIAYAYSHYLTTAFAAARRFWIHGALLAATMLFLPLGTREVPALGADAPPMVALLWFLSCTVAVPFFALSATNSLVQPIFARISGRDPAVLFAMSNAGSLLALLAYPFVIERYVGIKHQTLAWTIAYVVFALALVLFMRHGATHESSAPSKAETQTRYTARPLTVLGWTLRAALPSLLLSSVTLVLAADVAGFALLWVLPLALYLVTFVIAFAPKLRVSRRVLVLLTQAAILAALLLFASVNSSLIWRTGVLMAVLFFGCLLCHQDLARTRPRAEGLTQYYLFIAIGGALGSVFGNVIAPLVFDTIAEYPIALCLLALALVSDRGSRVKIQRALRKRRTLLVVAAPLVCFALWWLAVRHYSAPALLLLPFVFVCASMCLFRWPLVFPVTTLLLVHTLGTSVYRSGHALEERRSFFSVVRVKDLDNGVRVMVHGTTFHGAQILKAPDLPTQYYHNASPIAEVLASTLPKQRVAVVGLGTGTMAALAKPEQEFTFFEIDPVVNELATRWFSYLSRSPAKTSVVLGDARLTLAARPKHHFDLIVVDAFTSDSIPAHLVTEDALAMYLDKLAPGGIIAIHISNCHIDLRPVLRAAIDNLHIAGVMKELQPSAAAVAEDFAQPSRVVALARDSECLARLRSWQSLTGPKYAWTDDHSSVLPILNWSY